MLYKIKEDIMFKSLRVFTLAIALMTAFLPVLAACNNVQPAVRITPGPTTAPAKPVATTALATPASVATKVVSMTTEATSTPLTAKPTATPVKSSPLMTATTAAENASTSATTKANPTAVKPAAAKATPAAVKPAASKPAEVKLQLAKSDKLGEILTDARGMTLYTFNNDKPGESTCVDACAKTWPPLLVAKESDQPLLGQNVTGKVGVIERKDGTYQVTYNDMPLYYYAQDTKPGDTKGQEFKELWYVVR
jgi:predicted lipoprotein with Yx(FWY)xxD motif